MSFYSLQLLFPKLPMDTKTHAYKYFKDMNNFFNLILCIILKCLIFRLYINCWSPKSGYSLLYDNMETTNADTVDKQVNYTHQLRKVF